MSTACDSQAKSFDRLRRFVQVATRPHERCDLCSAALADEHSHLVEPASGRLLCVCEPCGILFGQQGTQRYRRVPRETVALDNFEMSDAHWANLAVPIGLAFFYRSTPAASILAVYPSPVGPMRAQPSAEAWEALAAENPDLEQFQPDVEALLVHRIHPARDYFRAPIDECYKLVGLVRSKWRGISGGPDLWSAIHEYFRPLHSRAK